MASTKNSTTNGPRAVGDQHSSSMHWWPMMICPLGRNWWLHGNVMVSWCMYIHMEETKADEATIPASKLMREGGSMNLIISI